MNSQTSTPKDHAITCPACGAAMILRTGKFGMFYGCSDFPKCDAICRADKNGKPIGRATDKRTRQARIIAHRAFDRLWTTGYITRGQAYKWLQRVMDMPEKKAHISRMSLEQCQLVYKLVEQKIDRLSQEDMNRA